VADEPQGARRIGTLAGMLLALRTAWRTTAGGPRTPPPMPPESELDPSHREVPSNPGAEALVALLLVAGAMFGFGFTAVYIISHGHRIQVLGIALGGAFAMLSAACIIAGKYVVVQETSVEERDLLLDEQVTEEVAGMIEAGGEGISRRKLLIGAGGIAGAGLTVAVATPLASLGPTLVAIHRTPWHRGVHMVDEQGRRYLASEIEIGSFYTALPEHGDPEELGAGLLVVKLPPNFIHLPTARVSWAPDGIVAYSKICPHAGCAISMYRYPLYQNQPQEQPAFTCPCHYSTFLPGEGGRLIYGPAGRSLPQLKVDIDPSDGSLMAGGPFIEDIGPSWWNVHRGESGKTL
jgi:ubiquinol-cytochrome c reductase iron-sulfur subunit